MRWMLSFRSVQPGSLRDRERHCTRWRLVPAVEENMNPQSQLALNTWCVQTIAMPLRLPDFFESIASLAEVMHVELWHGRKSVLVATWNSGTQWIN